MFMCLARGGVGGEWIIIVIFLVDQLKIICNKYIRIP